VQLDARSQVARHDGDAAFIRRLGQEALIDLEGSGPTKHRVSGPGGSTAGSIPVPVAPRPTFQGTALSGTTCRPVGGLMGRVEHPFGLEQERYCAAPEAIAARRVTAEKFYLIGHDWLTGRGPRGNCPLLAICERDAEATGSRGL
jgi:hypothetical protein